MPSCRCSCTAYEGACDCRADGLTQGRQRGLDEAVTGIASWLRRRAGDLAGHDEAAALVRAEWSDGSAVERQDGGGYVLNVDVDAVLRGVLP